MKEKELLLNFFKARRKYFDFLLKDKKIKNLFTCPSCGFPTLSERGVYEICILCNWEDDGQDDINSSKVLGGPNGNLSLDDSRISFEKKYNYLFRKKDELLNIFIEYNNIIENNLGGIKEIENKIKKFICYTEYQDDGKKQ